MSNNLSSLFYQLPQNLGKIFRPKNLPWHALAIVLTFLSVTSGFDWQYYKTTQIPSLRLLLFPAVFLGLLVPVFSPIVLLIIARIKNSARLFNTGFAIAQAALLGWLISAIYKTFTGRPGPALFGSLTDTSRIFKFGFLRGGVFWGWPSSHTTVAFAVSLCLYQLYPQNKLIKYSALIYAAYVGLAVSMTIHWFSDFLAGIIFGSLVGLTVGASFWERYKKN